MSDPRQTVRRRPSPQPTRPAPPHRLPPGPIWCSAISAVPSLSPMARWRCCGAVMPPFCPVSWWPWSARPAAASPPCCRFAACWITPAAARWRLRGRRSKPSATAPGPGCVAALSASSTSSITCSPNSPRWRTSFCPSRSPACRRARRGSVPECCSSAWVWGTGSAIVRQALRRGEAAGCRCPRHRQPARPAAG